MNIGHLVESSVYQAMLKNDKQLMFNTMKVINDLSGIEDINLYNAQDKPVIYINDTTSYKHGNPDCRSCHTDFETMFPRDESSIQIVNFDKAGNMSSKGSNYRVLIMRTPIFNQPACYTAECHAHSREDVVLGSMILRLPINNLYNTKSKAIIELFLFTLLASGMILLILIYYSKTKIKAPLNRLVAASDQIILGNLDARVEMQDIQLEDITKVSKAFNSMMDHIEKVNLELQNWSKQLEYRVQKKSKELSLIQDELIHIERMASLGKLSSSVAHEINNPLSGVLTYTKLIQKMLSSGPEAEPESVLKYLDIIEKEVKRCGDIVKNLLDFSRKDQQKFNYFSLNALLEETCEIMAHQFRISGIEFSLETEAEKDRIYCNENQIKQSFLAILVNASEAIDADGIVEVKSTNPDPDHISVAFTDNGCGISEEDLPHIFDPFYTSKQQKESVGLGLSVVHGIVQNHKGKISVDSKTGQGTTVTLIFPLSND